jgi:hypothetical protein
VRLTAGSHLPAARSIRSRHSSLPFMKTHSSFLGKDVKTVTAPRDKADTYSI